MQSMTTMEKIKLCLFNPVIFVILFVSTVISGASGNRALLEYFPSLFVLTILYPIFCKMAYRSFIDNLGVGFFLFVIVCYMLF